MAHPPEKRQALRAAYVYDRLPLDAAAVRVGVPTGTARRWKADADAQGDDWEKARAAASLSTAGAGAVAQIVVQDFLLLHQTVVDDLRGAADVPALLKAEALAKLADAFTKTMNAAAKAAPDLARYAVASETLFDLARYVADHHPEHAQALADVIEPFAADVAARYG